MENVKSKWIPELNKHLQNTPIVLIGTQSDLRNINTSQPSQLSAKPSTATAGRSNAKSYITTKEGEELKTKIKAFRYIECSALTQENINEVFETCIVAYEQSKKPNEPSIFAEVFSCFGLTKKCRTSSGDGSDSYTVKYKK
jgi:Ras-related C3 botulinum toxin substrate 1